jgi:hypothetical protein
VTWRGRWAAIGLVVLVVASAGTLGVVEGALTVRTVASAVALGLVLHLLDTLPKASDAPDELDAAVARAGRAHGDGDPPERVRLRSVVRSATSLAGYAHHRLRPLLRELADARLEAVFGTHLDSDDRAEERLGPAVWSWVRPDRPPPRDPFAIGPDLDELAAIVADLEVVASRAEEGLG